MTAKLAEYQRIWTSISWQFTAYYTNNFSTELVQFITLLALVCNAWITETKYGIKCVKPTNCCWI